MADLDDADTAAAYLVAEQMRAQRARLVEQVSAGATSIDGLLAEQGSERGPARVKIVALAEKVPGVGKVRARRAMASLDIAEDARFGEIEEATLRALWSTIADAATRPLRPEDTVSDA